MTRWGIVTTVKAPLRQIASFAAHHLDQGAHRIFLYLDDGDARMREALNAHPKLRVTLCDTAYWQKRGKERPEKHQPRQTLNAAHAYRRAEKDLDWLAHIDVDEFLVPAPDQPPLAAQLAALGPDMLCARIRPWEALADPDGDRPEHRPPAYYKGCAPAQAIRQKQTERIYPGWGLAMNGGFLSHVQGKMAYRTGLPGLRARIHNVFVDGAENPGQTELPTTRLLHLHAADFASFQRHFAFRHAQGSYRAELKSSRPKEQGGLSAHELFAQIQDEGGAEALRQFYDEVCTAHPALLTALENEGLLFQHRLDLDAPLARHFPDLA